MQKNLILMVFILLGILAFSCQHKENEPKSILNYAQANSSDDWPNISDIDNFSATLRNQNVTSFTVSRYSLSATTNNHISQFLMVVDSSKTDTLNYCFTSPELVSTICFKVSMNDSKKITQEIYVGNKLVERILIDLNLEYSVFYENKSLAPTDYFFPIFMSHFDLRTKNVNFDNIIGRILNPVHTNSTVTCYTPNGTLAANSCAKRLARDRCPGNSICIEGGSSTSGPNSSGIYTGTCNYSCGTC